MASENSLDQSMNSAKRHYSSLFFLPSFKMALIAVASLCVVGGGLSSVVLFASIGGLVNGLFLGASLLVLNLFFDYVVSKIVLRDPIFVLRRTAVLSVFCWIFLIVFVASGVILGALFGVLWWVKICLLGFSAVFTLRVVVFLASSSVGFTRGIIAALLQPLPCLIPFVVFWARLPGGIPISVLLYLVVSLTAGFASAFLYVSLLDRVGRRAYGMPTIPLFRAFMLNWVAALNEPLEGFFEKLGEDEDVEVSFLKFDSSVSKAAIIVPLVHPGPFKNVGSSLLPSMLKSEFEKAFRCVACVPLGILGHELDLASQKQDLRIVNEVISSARFIGSADKATPFVKATAGFATVSCQVFGETVLLSFTLAPKTTEDLPQELGRIVREEADKRGLKCAIVINAHNSIDEVGDMAESLDTLSDVASSCLDKAVSLPSESFEVGAHSVFPKDFSLKDGMGPGGITVIVVKVAEQKTAYVVIDGNNMITGLREKILDALASAGFDEGEVFTTDTHAVSAVVLGSRGYHPVGEVMNHTTLIDHINAAAAEAVRNLENCTAGGLRITVPKVRVIGEARLESLSLLVDKALKRARQLLIPIFGIEGLLLVLLLAVL